MALQPIKGANTQHFYVHESVVGETPTSPVWKALRFTGGIPTVAKDSLVSNELDGSRETSSVRTGNEQVSGEISVEFSLESQDDILAGAMTSSWVSGISQLGVGVAVSASAKTFTRSTGSFTGDGVEVGDLIAFIDLDGDNSLPFIVTSVSATVVTGAAIPHSLNDQAESPTEYKTGASLGTGNLCATFSILTWMKGTCGSPDYYIITRGCEFSGFTMEMSVNSFVTGSLPMIGRTQSIISSPPAGSTFDLNFYADPFASVDVTVFDGQESLRCDSLTVNNDNAASAQVELGNTTFVERGRAANTFSISGKLYDMTMIQKFLDETQVEITAIMSGKSGAMSVAMKRARLTGVTPEISGAESITQSIEGQATGNAMQSSIVIQRIIYT